MKKIKFTTRPNMKYLVSLIVLSLIKDVLLSILNYIFSFGIALMIVLVIFLGQFSAGGIAYLYQKKILKKKNSRSNAFMPITLIANDKIQIYDSKWKIYFLIFIAGFFDFADYALLLGLSSKMQSCSKSLAYRARGILIIFDALFYRFVLKLKISKHQRFSLYVISICIIITLIIEFFFQDFNIFLKSGEFALIILFIFIQILFNSFIDSIEKYLIEYDYVNPMKILMIEGGVSFFMSFIYCFVNNNNPIPLVKKYYEVYRESKVFPYAISLLVVVVIISGIQGIFKIETNKVYSPMALALAQYFFNPIYIILLLFLAKDFQSNKQPNYAYFSLNLILTIIISFCGCVYNEFIVLVFCRLEYETHEQIARRATLLDSDVELHSINECNDDDSNI